MNLFDTDAAAKRLGLSSVTLRKWRMTGAGPLYAKLGRSVRYSADAIDDWIASRSFRHTTEADFKLAA